MDKDTQTLEQVIIEQPKSYGSINDPNHKAVIPIDAKAKTNIENSCNNCQCCVFNFITNNYTQQQ